MPSKRCLWWLFTWLLVYAVHQIKSYMFTSTTECAWVIHVIRNQVTKYMKVNDTQTHTYIYIIFLQHRIDWIDSHLKLLSCRNPDLLLTHSHCDKTPLQKLLPLFKTLACLAWILDQKNQNIQHSCYVQTLPWSRSSNHPLVRENKRVLIQGGSEFHTFSLLRRVTGRV